MEYTIKKVVEEVDAISLSQEEYDKLNQFYFDIISSKYPDLAHNKQIYDVARFIMSDNLTRAEVIVTIDGKLPPNKPPASVAQI